VLNPQPSLVGLLVKTLDFYVFQVPQKVFKQSISQFKDKRIIRGYSNDIINKHVKFKYVHKHLFYHEKVIKEDENPPKHVICEADVLDRMFTKFISKINAEYGIRVFWLLKTSIN
jgi:hypothetical protein